MCFADDMPRIVNYAPSEIEDGRGFRPDATLASWVIIRDRET